MKNTKIHLILVAAAILGLISVVTTGCGKQSTSSSYKGSSEQHLSTRELMIERAKSRHGRDVRVDVQSGFYGGSYQVEVYVPDRTGRYPGGFDTYTYTAMADEKTQRVTVWELTSHH